MPKDQMLADGLSVALGQCSRAGVKPVNQDFHGAMVPHEPELTLKGITLALADGISTCPTSQEAAELAVTALMEDYYHTSDAWSVQTAGKRVIAASNAWIYGQNRSALHERPDQGQICTLSALILKGHFAHVLHLGDCRVWRLSGQSLEPLTEDHVARIASGQTVLARGIGLNATVEVDYRREALQLGDVYLLTSDGVHDHWDAGEVAQALAEAHDLQTEAERICDAALAAGSTDNLTVQIARVERLPQEMSVEALGANTALPILKPQEAGAVVDGFRIIRQIHSNNRSHIYLAEAPGGDKVALKIPATETVQDPDYMRSFVMEEWIARRLSSPQVLRAAKAPKHRSSLYVVTEFVEGQTLRQWMADHPNPELSAVRDLVGQMIKGLRAFHRKDMLHQDFRPENVMIDTDGTVKIIDLGATRVSGVQEARPERLGAMPGTLQYSAPEYFVGDPASRASDQFSLGVIAYEMLTGRLPYRADAARVQSHRDIQRLSYRTARDGSNDVPYWVDAALKRATHPDPARRFPALSEFEAALRAPPAHMGLEGPKPLLARDPLRFWQGLSLILGLIIVLLLAL